LNPTHNSHSIAITTEGKKESIREGAVEALMRLLAEDEMSDVRLNVIKVNTLSNVRLMTVKVGIVTATPDNIRTTALVALTSRI